MGILANPRHERFVQALAEGKSADEAYQLAGYRANRGNAARMKANENILMRLAEIQSAVAKKTAITIESICAELDAANAVAKAKGQAAAMVSAATLRAKLAGLMVEKVEVGKAGDFDDCESFADVADRMIDDMIERFRPVDQQDRDGLVTLIQRQANEMREYLNAIEARPTIAERVDARNLATPWQNLGPHSPPARLNHRNGTKAK